jgi:hypothetical protein
VQGADGVVARRAGEPAVYLLAPTVADYLPVSVDALRNRFLVEEKPPEEPEDPQAPGAPEAAPAPEATEP